MKKHEKGHVKQIQNFQELFHPNHLFIAGKKRGANFFFDLIFVENIKNNVKN